MVIALALMQAAAVAPVQEAPAEPMVLRAPPPLKWEDIPRPYRTAAENCVWDQVQDRIAPITGEVDAPLAETIGQEAVAACDTSISAWADSRTSEVQAGELPEDIKRRYQAHLAARGKEFAVGLSERFYVAEDRGEATVPGYAMSYTCEARMRRAMQRRLNIATRVDALKEELSGSAADEQYSMKNAQKLMELMTDLEGNENRIGLLQRDCPQFAPTSADEAPAVSFGNNDND